MPYWLMIRQGQNSSTPWHIAVQSFATHQLAWAYAEKQEANWRGCGMKPPEYAVFYGAQEVGRDGKAVA
jgi:hypothetical protein